MPSAEIMNKMKEMLREAGPAGLTKKQIHLRIQSYLEPLGDSIGEKSIWNYMENLIEEGAAYKKKANPTAPNEYIAIEFHPDLPRVKETAEMIGNIDTELPPESPVEVHYNHVAAVENISTRDQVLLLADAITVLRNKDREMYKPIEEMLFDKMKDLLK